MNRWFGACVVGLWVVGGTVLRAEDDPIRTKLDQAIATYDAEVEKYRAAVIDYLDKREAAARKDANKRLVDQITLEREAFAEKGEAPKTLASTIKTQMVAARLNLESAYKTAVKDYTRGKQDEKATLVEKELDAFRKADAVVPPVLPTPPGPFQVRSVWVSDNPAMSLTVTERRGGTFRARFLIGEKIDRDVIGTIKDNKLTWLGKDAKALKGTPGNDNYGTITNDQIDFVWRNDTGGSGTFTLRLHKIK